MKKEKTHMTDLQRAKISLGLSEGRNFAQIAKEIGVDATTVSREIRKHIQTEKKGAAGRGFNDCAKRMRCQSANERCEKKRQCRKESCRWCVGFCCTDLCGEYEKQDCKKLERPPYVCNGCAERGRCTLEKSIYDPLKAHFEYKDVLSGCRKVLHVTRQELDFIGRTIGDGLKKGQSINQIFSYAGEAMPISQRSVYNYVNDGLFDDAIRLDLPKAVRCRRRSKPKHETAQEDRSYLKGRTYADYLLRIGSGSCESVVQMDCVEGPKGSSACLLTLLFPVSKLQIAVKMEEKTRLCAALALRGVEMKIGSERFARLFQVILTDRGSEFSDPDALETGISGEKISSIYFCDPRRSDQKGSCERNHSELRRIFPKGTNFSIFSQEQVSLALSHVNSLARPSDNNKTAYEMFCFFYEDGTEILDSLGIQRIPPQMLSLTPSLFK